MDILEKLNKNLKASRGGMGYETEILEVVKVGSAYAADLKVSVQKDYEKNPWFVIVLKRANGEKFTVKQMCFFTQSGEVQSPYATDYRRKDGKYAPSTLVYDIANAIKAHNPELGLDFKGLSVWDSKNWNGMQFEMGLKVGELKDGSGKWYILETDEQKYYDELRLAHHAATNEWVNDKAILRDMDNGTYPKGKVNAIDLNTIPDDLGKPTEVEKNFKGSDLEKETKPVKETKKSSTAVDDDDLPF